MALHKVNLSCGCHFDYDDAKNDDYCNYHSGMDKREAAIASEKKEEDNMPKLNPTTGQFVGRITDDMGHISTIRTDSIYGYSNKECRELERGEKGESEQQQQQQE